MTDEELLEWYKNGGKKTDDMSDQDYELNMNNALKLQKNETLQQNLNNQQAALAKAQTNAQQSASISNEKLMKYLGQRQLASGVASGQTGSDFINANNSYMQTRATIANNAAVQQNDLLDSYASNKLANETEAYNNQVSILDKYRQQAIEDEQLANQEEDRKMQIEQWELEMEAYKQELQNTMEDREASKLEKEQAKQEQEDIEWLEAANERLNQMYSVLMDEEGKLSEDAKQRMLNEMETYKDKFNSDRYYERLLDFYRTMVYDGN